MSSDDEITEMTATSYRNQQGIVLIILILHVENKVI